MHTFFNPNAPFPTWQQFLKRPDNIGLNVMQAKQKYLTEQTNYYRMIPPTPSFAAAAGGTNAPAGPTFTNNFSLTFDGTDDFVAIPDLGTQYNHLDGLDTFSISMWVKPSASPVSSTMGIFGLPKSGYTWNLAAYYVPASTQIGIQVNSAGSNDYVNNSVTLSTSAFSHLAFVFDRATESGGARIKVYVNGDLKSNETSGAWSQIASAGNHPLHIGAYQQGAGGIVEWTGEIDEVGIFNTALSQTDVNTIYNGGSPNDISSLNPLQYFRFEEGTGTTAIDGGSLGLDGTLKNNTAYSTDVPG